jgi:hypothetical protein
MNRILTTIFLTVGLSVFLALGQEEGKASTGSKEPQAEQTLRQIENDTLDALVKGDISTLNRIWADEYSFTPPNGTVVSKENYLALLQSGSVKYDSLKSEGLRVRIYGDTAVVSGSFAVRGRVGTHELNGTDRFLTVYVKRQGRWQQVASQASRIDRQPLQ